jgi:hypothetical protein
LRAGFPHSDILGSKLVCQLPEAFRRLPRPSSPVIAKASTTCTLSLDPITLNALASISSSRFDFSAWLRVARLLSRATHDTIIIPSRFNPDLSQGLKRFSTSSKFLKISRTLQPVKIEASSSRRPSLTSRFAPYHALQIGGADRDRTDDPLVANQVLSQLSYSPRFPVPWWVWVDLNHRPHAYQACALTN